MSRRENKVTPRVVSGTLYMETGALSVESSEWWVWLEHGETFYFESPEGTFTARYEERPHSKYWYSYRRRRGKLYKLYLGKSAELTMARLGDAAQQLAERVG